MSRDGGNSGGRHDRNREEREKKRNEEQDKTSNHDDDEQEQERNNLDDVTAYPRPSFSFGDVTFGVSRDGILRPLPKGDVGFYGNRSSWFHSLHPVCDSEPASQNASLIPPFLHPSITPFLDRFSYWTPPLSMETAFGQCETGHHQLTITGHPPVIVSPPRNIQSDGHEAVDARLPKDRASRDRLSSIELRSRKEAERRVTMEMLDDDKAPSSCASSSQHPSNSSSAEKNRPVVYRPLPIFASINPLLLHPSPPSPSPPTSPPPPSSSPPPVLSSSAVNRCRECNIVFQRLENFLVHKDLYCAGRRNNDRRFLTHRQMATSRHHQQHPPRSLTHLPGSWQHLPLRNWTPRRSIRCLRPLTSDPVVDGRLTSDLWRSVDRRVKFSCSNCAIQFHSLDTLKAHRKFYCPSRIIEQPTPVLTDPQRHASLHDPFDLSRATPLSGLHTMRNTAPINRDTVGASPGIYRCALCGYLGNTLRGLRLHGKAVHCDRGKPFTDKCVILIASRMIEHGNDAC